MPSKLTKTGFVRGTFAWAALMGRPLECPRCHTRWDTLQQIIAHTGTCWRPKNKPTPGPDALQSCEDHMLMDQNVHTVLSQPRQRDEEEATPADQRKKQRLEVPHPQEWQNPMTLNRDSSSDTSDDYLEEQNLNEVEPLQPPTPSNHENLQAQPGGQLEARSSAIKDPVKKYGRELMNVQFFRDPTFDPCTPQELFIALSPLMQEFPVDGITRQDLWESMADNWQRCYKRHWKTTRRNGFTKAANNLLFENVDPLYRGFIHRWLEHSPDKIAVQIQGGLQQPHEKLQILADSLFGDILEGTRDDFYQYACSKAFKQCGLRIHLHHTCLGDDGHYDATKGAFSPYLFMEHFFAVGDGRGRAYWDASRIRSVEDEYPSFEWDNQFYLNRKAFVDQVPLKLEALFLWLFHVLIDTGARQKFQEMLHASNEWENAGPARCSDSVPCIEWLAHAKRLFKRYVVLASSDRSATVMQDFKLPNGQDPQFKLGDSNAFRELLFDARIEAGKHGVIFAENWKHLVQPLPEFAPVLAEDRDPRGEKPEKNFVCGVEI